MDLGFKCVEPYISGKDAFPCGQCIPCRTNRRRIWSHRIMLEAAQHEENAFVTLTYSDEKVPVGGTLVREDLQAWIKRLRRINEPKRLRYFACGEYGDRTGRPHYHAAVFGLACQGLGRFGGSYAQGGCECPTCLGVRKSWSFGYTYVGGLEMRSAQYIAGYVTKKLKFKEEELSTKVLPFVRMSLKPGIGATALADIASVLVKYRMDSVPVSLRHGKQFLPLGRYLRKRLLKDLVLAGYPIDENMGLKYLEALRTGLLPVWDAAEEVCSHPTLSRYKRLVVADAIRKNNAQGAANLAARIGRSHEKEQV